MFGWYYLFSCFKFSTDKAQEALMWITMGTAALFFAVGLVHLAAQLPLAAARTMWGSAAVGVLAIYYTAPLSTMAAVLRQRDSSSLNAPLSVMNVVNGCLWFAYGLAIRDYFIMLPNGVGAALNVVCVLLCEHTTFFFGCCFAGLLMYMYMHRLFFSHFASKLRPFPLSWLPPTHISHSHIPLPITPNTNQHAGLVFPKKRTAVEAVHDLPHDAAAGPPVRLQSAHFDPVPDDGALPHRAPPSSVSPGARSFFDITRLAWRSGGGAAANGGGGGGGSPRRAAALGGGGGDAAAAKKAGDDGTAIKLVVSGGGVGVGDLEAASDETASASGSDLRISAAGGGGGDDGASDGSGAKH